MIQLLHRKAIPAFFFFSILFSLTTVQAQSNCTTQYAVSVNSYSGSLLYLSNTTTGAADGSGVKFNRGNSGSSNTQMTWDMGEVIPSGTDVTIRVKLEHCSNAASGTTNSVLRVCAKDQSSGNFVAQGSGPYYFSNSSYHTYTITLDRATRYIMVEDLGGCAFRLDNLEWEKCATCIRQVMNTRGCSGTPYVIYLKDSNNNSYHLSGDSTQYSFKEYSNGTARFIADNLTVSGLAGSFDVDLVFSGKTTSAPTNSPKNSSCFTTGSSAGWEYYVNTSGTITASSSTYGTMQIGRAGPAFQVGSNANITQSGFGGSGWLSISGGTGVIASGDINLMLGGCEDVCTDKYAVQVSSQSGSLHHTSNTTTGAPDGSGVKFDRGNSGSSNTQMTWDMGEIIPSGTEIKVTLKLAHCYNASSGTSSSVLKFYAKDTSTGNYMTQGSGSYSFNNTSYQTYTVTLDRDSRYLKIKDMGGCAFRIDALAWEDCQYSANEISGTVYKDLNANSDMDTSEPIRANVTVYLYSDANHNGVVDGAEGSPIDSLQTDTNGFYIFTVPYNGGTESYVVSTDRNDFPAGVRYTEANNNIQTASFSSGGNLDDENDFGFVPIMSIGSTVFLDENGDGSFNGTDSGISGVIVEVYTDANGDGVPDSGSPVSVDTTDANGDYFITNLVPGKYVVVIPANQFEGVLLGYQTSSEGNGGDDSQDGDDNGIQSAGSGTQTISITIDLQEDLEPTSESGQGGNQDVASGGLDANGNMTVDFGFYCGTEVFADVTASVMIISSEFDQVDLTISVTTNDLVGAADFTLLSYYEVNGSKSGPTTAVTPTLLSGDVNGNDTLEISETWVFGDIGQTFNYERGDVITYFLVIESAGCRPFRDTASVRIRTFGTNAELQIEQGCFEEGDTVELNLITRLLIDEDFEKNPTDVSGNPIKKFQYDGENLLLKINSINSNNWFDPFNPPTGLTLVAFSDQNNVDSGRRNDLILDECEPINTERARAPGSDLDINGQFPDWKFTFDWVVPAGFNFDTFLFVGSDSFDVVIYEERSVGSGTFDSLTTYYSNVFTDDLRLDRCRYDFGDAPQVFGTLDTVGSLIGAAHREPKVDTTHLIFLGNTIDYEANGTPTTFADGDDNIGSDDEDGWLNAEDFDWVLDSLDRGATKTLEFKVTNTSDTDVYLSVYIDVNDNDTFDSAETIKATISRADTAQLITLQFVVPMDAAIAQVTARVRLTSDSTIGSTGVAPDGEVEDYGGVQAIPVELIMFTGELKGEKDVLLNWTTATELNNRGFEVQRRMDNENKFRTIDFVDGFGTSMSKINYSLVDYNNYWSSSVAYYRLKQVDFDGNYGYSNIVAVAKKGVLDAVVYPNPTKGGATVTVLTDIRNAQKSVKIFDIFGVDVSASVNITSLGEAFNLNTESLRSGTYFIEVLVNNQKVVKRLVLAK
ncbi:MAG: hypothetical protein COA58_13805 [Bacteroidetes bacterium]|nr:MAG: hypothetical protein COA58_13805 [Bacteroidota bacterium]